MLIPTSHSNKGGHMKTISLSTCRENPSVYGDMKEVLENEGLVCFPARSGYKIAADLSSRKAVTTLLHAKRRVKNAPTLIFLPDKTWATRVGANLCDDAKRLMEAYWPGSLTLLVEAGEELHPKIRRELTRATGWIGIRVPDDEVPLAVTQAFGKPLLVSSANLSKKHGSHSLAQVKKSFGRSVNLLIEDGDLPVGPSSTLVDVSGGHVEVVRASAISEDDINKIPPN